MKPVKSWWAKQKATSFAKWLAKAINRVVNTLWWWGVLLTRFLGKHYVWLFFLAFVGWLWWQGFHLLVAMSALITQYADQLIETSKPGQSGATTQNYDGIRNLLLGLAALLSVPFFFLRTWLNERQTSTQEQGHMTDRIAKAVEALGSEKQIKKPFGEPYEDGKQQIIELTVPNLEVRIGAIYALERISQDSARDHWQVMEILTAYLRENAKDWPNGPPPSSDEFAKMQDWRIQQGPARIDFQAIITVLARRSRRRRLEEQRKNQNLDLRGVHICGADFQIPNGKADFGRARFSGSSFVFANLRGANFSEADLSGAKLSGADLSWADFTWANFFRADLFRADLFRADLTGANLTRADLRGADLSGVDITGANLLGADLFVANLSGAYLSGADLTRAYLSGADLTKAYLSGADLSRADLTRADLFGANLFGANLSDNSFVAEVLGLRQAIHLDEADLPKGWSVRWNEADKAWDITTPDGPYIDPDERD